MVWVKWPFNLRLSLKMSFYKHPEDNSNLEVGSVVWTYKLNVHWVTPFVQSTVSLNSKGTFGEDFVCSRYKHGTLSWLDVRLPDWLKWDVFQMVIQDVCCRQCELCLLWGAVSQLCGDCGQQFSVSITVITYLSEVSDVCASRGSAAFNQTE